MNGFYSECEVLEDTVIKRAAFHSNFEKLLFMSLINGNFEQEIIEYYTALHRIGLQVAPIHDLKSDKGQYLLTQMYIPGITLSVAISTAGKEYTQKEWCKPSIDICGTGDFFKELLCYIHQSFLYSDYSIDVNTQNFICSETNGLVYIDLIPPLNRGKIKSILDKDWNLNNKQYSLLLSYVSESKQIITMIYYWLRTLDCNQSQKERVFNQMLAYVISILGVSRADSITHEIIQDDFFFSRELLLMFRE